MMTTIPELDGLLGQKRHWGEFGEHIPASSRGIDDFNVQVFDIEDIVGPQKLAVAERVTVNDLVQRNEPKIRVILVRDDEPRQANISALYKLFHNFSIPYVFLSERTHSVTHSFGARDSGGTYCSWFHLLFKDNQTPEDKFEIVEDRTWIKVGMYFKWNKAEQKVVLICFGMMTFLAEPLQNFRSQHGLAQDNLGIMDPFALFAVILHVVFEAIDNIVWKFLGWVAMTENLYLEGGKPRNKAESGMSPRYQQDMLLEDKEGLPVNFWHQHNLAKHIIHLREGIDAIAQTMGAMKCEHDDFMKKYTVTSCDTGNTSNKRLQIRYDTADATRRNLDYIEQLFCSIQNRVASLERRTANIITFSFNSVTLRETIAAKQDSRSMYKISMVTYVFLPVTAVATICGSNFFSYEVPEAGQEKFNVSRRFWVFWVVSIAVMLATFLCHTGATLVSAWWQNRLVKRNIKAPGTAGIV